MKTQKISTFLAVIQRYFAQFDADELKMETPYLSEKKSPAVYDYTGVIGISGIMKGVVYVSATKALLCAILCLMNEDNDSTEMLADLVGEIANTVAGNARTEFGNEFHISVPFVFKGSPTSVVLPKTGRAVVIPILWQGEKGEIVVCLDKH